MHELAKDAVAIIMALSILVITIGLLAPSLTDFVVAIIRELKKQKKG